MEFKLQSIIQKTTQGMRSEQQYFSLEPMFLADSQQPDMEIQQLFTAIVDLYKDKRIHTENCSFGISYIASKQSGYISLDKDDDEIDTIFIDFSFQAISEQANVIRIRDYLNTWEIMFKTKKQYEIGGSILNKVISHHVQGLEIDEPIFLPQPQKLDFLLKTIKTNPEAVLNDLKKTSHYMHIFMRQMTKNIQFETIYSKYLELFHHIFFKGSYHMLLDLLNPDYFQTVLTVFCQSSNEWRKQLNSSKQFNYWLDSEFMKLRYALLAHGYLKKYLTIVGVYKIDDLGDNINKIAHENMFTQTEQKLRILILQHILREQSVPKMLNRMRLCLQKGRSKVTDNEQQKTVQEQNLLEEQLQISQIGSFLAQLFYLVDKIKVNTCNKEKVKFYSHFEDSNFYSILTQSLMYESDDSMANIVEAVSQATPITFLKNVEQDWTKVYDDWQPQTKLLGIFIERYKNGQKQSFEVIKRILINTCNKCQDLNSFKEQYNTLRGLIEKSFHVLLGMCEGIPMKLQFMKAIKDVIQEIPFKQFTEDDWIDCYQISSITNSDFYSEVVTYFNSKMVHNKNDLLNLSMLLRMSIKATTSINIIIDLDQEKRSQIERMVIESGLMELCTTQLLKIVAKNNLISSSFLCSFKLLENCKKSLYRQYLMSQRESLRQLQKYLPKTLMIQNRQTQFSCERREEQNNEGKTVQDTSFPHQQEQQNEVDILQQIRKKVKTASQVSTEYCEMDK